MARRPVLKLLCGILLGLALLMGAFFLWIRTVSERRWTELKSRIPELVAEAEARDPRRPPLGEPLPGNAWDDYHEAFGALAGFDLMELVDYLSRSRDVRQATIDFALGASRGVFEPLERGSRRTEGAFPREGFVHSDSVGKVALLAAVQARAVIQGRDFEFARERLLRAAQLLADMGRDARAINHYVAMSYLNWVFREMATLPPDPKLARALAVLDSSWPDVGDALRNEALFALETLGKGEPLSVEHRDLRAWDAWRYGFSKRLMDALGMEAALDLLREAADVSVLPWNDPRRRELERDERDARESANPVLRELMDRPAVDELSRERRAQLRLLRRYHGETAEMDDPFGGSLKRWSVGPNGVDDSGTKDDILLERP